jgi:hypothetical protein
MDSKNTESALYKQANCKCYRSYWIIRKVPSAKVKTTKPDLFEGTRTVSAVDGWLRATERYCDFVKLEDAQSVTIQYTRTTTLCNIYNLTYPDVSLYPSWLHTYRLTKATTNEVNAPWFRPAPVHTPLLSPPRMLALPSSRS